MNKMRILFFILTIFSLNIGQAAELTLAAALLLLIPVGLIAKQPDLGTALLVLAAARPVATLVYVWEHSIVYHQPGTRSEGRSHYLTCNGTLLPDVFALVVLPDGRSFAFGTRSQLWGDDGYVPADLVKLPASPTAITSNSLAVGFYLGDSRLAGTPAGWFHARRDGWQAFIDPTRANRLEPLPRQRQAELAPSAKP